MSFAAARSASLLLVRTLTAWSLHLRTGFQRPDPASVALAFPLASCRPAHGIWTINLLRECSPGRGRRPGTKRVSTIVPRARPTISDVPVLNCIGTFVTLPGIGPLICPLDEGESICPQPKSLAQGNDPGKVECPRFQVTFATDISPGACANVEAGCDETWTVKPKRWVEFGAAVVPVAQKSGATLRCVEAMQLRRNLIQVDPLASGNSNNRG